MEGGEADQELGQTEVKERLGQPRGLPSCLRQLRVPQGPNEMVRCRGPPRKCRPGMSSRSGSLRGRDTRVAS